MLNKYGNLRKQINIIIDNIMKYNKLMEIYEYLYTYITPPHIANTTSLKNMSIKKDLEEIKVHKEEQETIACCKALFRG